LPYAELLDADGKVLSDIEQSDSTAVPSLPATLSTANGGGLFSTGSGDGSGDWRVYTSATNRPTGGTVVVALPLSDVDASLQRLVLIEASAAAALLALIATGSWLILRRGLRPLEHMAGQARTITAGDLSERVTPADGRTEVGQLGLALNTMLAEIEGAFQERGATEQRLRQFLADASHELRTPLTSIQGFAELARLGADQEHVDPAIVQRRIEEEAARMKVLVEDLLLLARLDETRPPSREAVDLTVLAADACSDAVALDPSRRITLIAPAPVVVLGDPDHLRQAIGNLAANAVRHTPAGSRVEVTTRVEGSEAVVSVSDDGHGLDEAALQHVFDRFWRADHARIGHSTGLGLSIVAGIAHEHGGTASAANRPGGGAIFTLRLPVSRPADRDVGAVETRQLIPA
jgi:two-component system OmpR family sensor kinase